MSHWLFPGCAMLMLTLAPSYAASEERGGLTRQPAAPASAGRVRVSGAATAENAPPRPKSARPVSPAGTPSRQRVVQTSASAVEPRSNPVTPAAAMQTQSSGAGASAGDVPQEPLPSVLGIRDLISLAEGANPILRRSSAEIEAAKGDRVQAGLYPNPRMETNNPEIWSGQNSFVNFGFQQDIVVKGKMRMERAAADQLVRRERANYQLDRMKMMTEIRRQYVYALAAKHRLQVSKYLVIVTRRGLTAAQQLEDAGEGTLTDVLLLDTEAQRALGHRDAAETTLEGEYQQLAAVVGMPEMDISDLTGTLLMPTPEFDADQVRSFIMQDSSFMEMYHADLLRNKTLLRRAEVEMYPNIRMGPSFQAGTQQDSAQFWLSVVFEIPVWDLNQGNIRKARAMVHQSDANIDVIRNELMEKVADLVARHRAANQVAERIRTSILPNAQRTQELVQDGYNKGQFDVNRLLQSQRNLSEIAGDYIDSSEQAWRTAADIAGLMQIEEFP